MVLVFKDEKDNFEEKYAQIIQIFLSKRSALDPDSVQLFRIRPYPDPQHWKKNSVPALFIETKYHRFPILPVLCITKRGHSITNVFVRTYYKVKRCVKC
jgi:hypothetical protein